MITNIVKVALGMEPDDINQQEIKDNWAEIILHSEKEGTFEKLWISNEISSNIVENDLWIEAGTKVGGFAGANEAIGTMVLKFDSEIQMNNVLNNQNNYIKVIVD